MKQKGLMIAALGLFLFSQAAQADWTVSRRITWTSGESCDPATAIDSGGTIHVVWYDQTPGNEEIYYKKSTDGGATWTTSHRLTWTSGRSLGPAIAIDSGNTIHVVWEDDTPGYSKVHYKSSADGGTTWSAAQRLTWTSGGSRYPAIAIDSSNTIHVVWCDSAPGNWDIYYKGSTDGGTTWSAAQRLTWTSGGSYYPAIAIDSSGTIHLVWQDETPGKSEIYYKGSTDGGANWSAAQRLTWTSGSSYYAAIAINSNDTIHLVWSDETPGNSEIYYKGSTDGGVNWSATQRLTWTSGESYYPAIAIDSADTIHIVWEDYTYGNSEMCYKGSTDEGATWSAAQRLTWTSGWSYFPAIAIDSSNTIHVVWYDDSLGNYEIYYKNGQ